MERDVSGAYEEGEGLGGIEVGADTYRKTCFVPSRGGRRVAIVFVAMMKRLDLFDLDIAIDAGVENKVVKVDRARIMVRSQIQPQMEIDIYLASL
jgi:hypothetical protein